MQHAVQFVVSGEVGTNRRIDQNLYNQYDCRIAVTVRKSKVNGADGDLQAEVTTPIAGTTISVRPNIVHVEKKDGRRVSVRWIDA